MEDMSVNKLQMKYNQNMAVSMINFYCIPLFAVTKGQYLKDYCIFFLVSYRPLHLGIVVGWHLVNSLYLEILICRVDNCLRVLWYAASSCCWIDVDYTDEVIMVIWMGE